MPSRSDRYRRLAVDLEPEDFELVKKFAAEQGLTMKELATSCLRACGVLPQRPKWTPKVEVDAEAA